MASYQYQFEDAAADRRRDVLITKMDGGVSAPLVFAARSMPATPGVQGYGTTEAGAIVDLFRAERDANRST